MKQKRNLCLTCKKPRPISSWFCPKCEAIISAAPELLGACKALVFEAESGIFKDLAKDMPSTIWAVIDELIKPAIAKAEGK
jgi:hypothetical protein